MVTGSKQPHASAAIELTRAADAVLVQVRGLVDEHFSGFGSLRDPTSFVDQSDPTSLIIDVSGMTRMTSFGVRQWRRALDGLPKSISNLYLLGCPTFFVDQLNMVLNFGGNAVVLTAMAPYTCSACGAESSELIDVLGQRALLLKGGVPEKECTRCGAKLELDEAPGSYFSFVGRHAGTTLDPAAAELLATAGLYERAEPPDSADEKPPRIIKIVQGAVTYFRVIGRIGSLFRARPFLVGAEGEVVIDLAEVDRVDATGVREWKRLLKSLTGQVPAVTLVDVGESLLRTAPETLNQARNLAVWSVLVPYHCTDCGRTRADSQPLGDMTWPYQPADQVCPTCGGTTKNIAATEMFALLQKAATDCPPASAKLIRRRAEVLSRALTDANVAQAGAEVTTIHSSEAILGKYKIVRPLSSGGMAEVFLAKQIGIGGFEKTVALKRIQGKMLERRHLAIDLFLNEAKIAGRLTHPNIVQVLDVGEVGGELYLAMEYVHGHDLRETIRCLQKHDQAMPLAEACYIVREVAQALHHAYWSTDLEGNQLAVVHRDVSPHNVILGYDGTVKLLDFGVAMSAVTEQEAMIVGKWMYMSPEATTNQAIDHRSDLFSLGIMTYLLCTGSLPFSGRDAKEIVKKIRGAQYKPLLEHDPTLPPELAELVARMLSPSPQHRPQAGLEIADALGDIVRRHGLESSPADIAYVLSTFFPEQSEATATVIEVPPDWRDSSPSIRRRSANFSISNSLSSMSRTSSSSLPEVWTHPRNEPTVTRTTDATTIDPPRGDSTLASQSPEQPLATARPQRQAGLRDFAIGFIAIVVVALALYYGVAQLF